MILPTLLVLVGFLVELTHIRLLIVVCLHVGLQCPLCREPLVTDGTGEGLHFLVDVLDVSIAIAPVGEFGLTNVTGIEYFPGVPVHVPFKAERPAESLGAELALVFFEARVYVVHVSVPGLLLPKHLVAIQALPGVL